MTCVLLKFAAEKGLAIVEDEHESKLQIEVANVSDKNAINGEKAIQVKEGKDSLVEAGRRVWEDSKQNSEGPTKQGTETQKRFNKLDGVRKSGGLA